jgi:beta-barrel assembly-enhancing protease
LMFETHTNDVLSFEGGVFSKSLQDGRGGATLRVAPHALEAHVTDGSHLTLDYRDMRLEMGGASGKMVFCRPAQGGEPTFFCESRGFIEALGRVDEVSFHRSLGQLRRAKQKRQRVALFWWTLLLTSVVGLATCTLGVVGTGAQWGADKIPLQIDQMIGDAAIEAMDLGGPKLEDEAAVAVPKAIVNILSKHLEIEDLKLTIHVVDSPQVNAFALPGGQMVVFAGLLKKARNPEEVAGVLAHEVAHVTQRHGVVRLLRSVGLMAMVQLFLGDVSGVLAVATEILTLATINNYSREQEAQADREGVRLLHASAIEPSGLKGFFEVLEEQKKEQGKTLEALEKSLNWMSTHPETEARIQAVDAFIKTLEPTTYPPLDVPWGAMKTYFKESKETSK